MDDFENQGALYKRKDFLDKEEGAKNHPNRTYYFRKNVDVDKLIESCTHKLADDPEFTKTEYLVPNQLFQASSNSLTIGPFVKIGSSFFK